MVLDKLTPSPRGRRGPRRSHTLCVLPWLWIENRWLDVKIVQERTHPLKLGSAAFVLLPHFFHLVTPLLLDLGLELSALLVNPTSQSIFIRGDRAADVVEAATYITTSIYYVYVHIYAARRLDVSKFMRVIYTRSHIAIHIYTYVYTSPP